VNTDHGTISHCESYSNQKGGTGSDGGGFDLDNNSTNCVVQYNYSHDNVGAGYLIFDYDDHTGQISTSNNIVRYNLSENDARRTAQKTQAGIWVNSGMDKAGTKGFVDGLKIYN